MPYKRLLEELRRRGAEFYGPKSGLMEKEKGWVVAGVFVAPQGKRFGESLLKKHLPEYLVHKLQVLRPLKKQRVEKLAKKPGFQELVEKKGGVVHQLSIFIPKGPPKKWEPKIRLMEDREKAWKALFPRPKEHEVRKAMGLK